MFAIIISKLAASVSRCITPTDVSRVITPIEDWAYGIEIEQLDKRAAQTWLQPLPTDEDAALLAYEQERREEAEAEAQLHGERYAAWAQSYRDRGMEPPGYDEQWCVNGCQRLYGSDCGVCGYDGFGCYEHETRFVMDLDEDGRYVRVPREEIEAEEEITYNPRQDARDAWKATYRAARMGMSGHDVLEYLLVAGTVRRDCRAEARASRRALRLQTAIEQETDPYARAVMRGAVQPDLTLI